MHFSGMRISKAAVGAVGLGLAIGLTGLRAWAGEATDVQLDIPFKKVVLTNGLTLIVHEDHKAPIVAVNLWYHVASKNEAPGKTGFAHLFEHLMFTGSEHFKGSGDQRAFFEAMERIGATDLNGTTSNDRTDFFENVPTNALDVALWIESDRMGHLLGSIDQARLDTQRGVVQNEKRQGENQPYGLVEELITKGTAPAGHPYSWTVIGSMEDLNAASLTDVKTWFTNYYGAANAVLVLAGDIDTESAVRKVEHYFGDIPSGPPVAAFKTWIPKIPGTRREIAADHVPLARLYKVWNIPAYGDADSVYLGLASDVLVLGKTGRLYKRLVYDDQLATDVSASADASEISGQFQIMVTARPGVDVAKIEKAADEEVARFLAEGPTPQELQRVKAAKVAGFVRGAERIGGFGGKSDILAMNQTFRGDPAFYKTVLKYASGATAGNLQRAAKQWLTDDVYVLDVEPFPKFETAAATVDRSKLPEPGADADVRFQGFQRSQLSNGLKILLAERHALPLVNFALEVDAGFAADTEATAGAAKLTMQMLDEGTARRTAQQISEEVAALGAEFGARSSLDSCAVGLSAVTPTLDAALDIYQDVILHPAFPEADFQRLQKQLLDRIAQEKTEPFGIAWHAYPRLLYGAGHAYGKPLTGSGTEASVAKLTRADLIAYHDTWFKANNASLIIVGDTTLAEITPKLEKLFGAWPAGDVPKKVLATIERRKKAIYLIDRPDSPQSVVLAAHVGLPKANPHQIAIETMNTILGNAFTSRVNMNLREDKHWSYGAGTFILDSRGQGPFVAFGPVQADKTKESMVELDKELRGILEAKPITEDELVKAQKSQTLSLPGNWETLDSVAGSLGEMVRYGLPDDYFTTYPANVRALKLADVQAAAHEAVHPDDMVWVVVGDRAKIESSIRDLGWGDVQIIDPDGNPAK